MQYDAGRPETNYAKQTAEATADIADDVHDLLNVTRDGVDERTDMNGIA